jgi:hypothetical protein
MTYLVNVKYNDEMKAFDLIYLLEPIHNYDSFYTKPMFGGLAVYFNGLMVLILMEDNQTRQCREKKYPFPIWNGLLIPTDRCHHKSLRDCFSSLIEHPVLGKWLFLSLCDDDFENQAKAIVFAIKKLDSRIGILPKEKKRAKHPKNLRGLRNLGIKSEAELKSVGISTVSLFLQIGWEEVFCRLVLAYPHRNNVVMLSALIGACNGLDWRDLSEEQKFEARKWVKFFK